MDIGYIRVSTQSQSLDRQTDELTAQGVDPACIYADKKTGRSFAREGLDAALGYMREGDRLIVASLDRLGRDLPGVLSVVGDLDSRGITLISLKESIDTSTNVGRMLVGIFGSLAEYEVSLMRERAADARAAREQRGKPTGRPRALSDQQVRHARYRRDVEGESVRQIARDMKVSHATLYRALNLGSSSAAVAT